MHSTNSFDQTETPLHLVTPLLLAGGQSRRMGTNKSFVQLGERSLIEIIVDRLWESFGRCPLIVTNEPQLYTYLKCPMIGDMFKGQGPLAGLHAALLHVRTGYVFAFACDMPFIAGDFIQYMMKLLGSEDILIPRNQQGDVEPLHALYSVRCLPVIVERLQNGQRSVGSIFNELKVSYVEMNKLPPGVDCPDMFMNINTLAELTNAKKLLKEKGTDEKAGNGFESHVPDPE
ncbi:MAG TPA: molybdenum cofactor guanylyltransferase [Patescibacteria group bacterium]|nr:molybdenum cofactor guanylyltransferase [Patescibacteria group bacterium]